jgi:hypothetical protein
MSPQSNIVKSCQTVLETDEYSHPNQNSSQAE